MRKPLVLIITCLASVGLFSRPGEPVLSTPGGSTPASDEHVEVLLRSPEVVATAEAQVEFQLRLMPRKPEAAREEPLQGVARLSLREPRTGQPLRGVRPMVWLSRRGERHLPPDEDTCRSHIKQYLSGHLSSRPDVNLNSYLLLTLNHDHTVSVIDPQVALSRTKLEHLVRLPGKAGDWALLREGQALYVSVPAQDVVSVVDTRRFTVSRNVKVGRQPGWLALAPDERTVWVSNEGDETISVMDTSSHEVVAVLPVGAGKHEIVFGEDGATAWVLSSQSEELLVVEVATRKVLARVNVGEGAQTAAWSEKARALYVVNERTAELLVVDGVQYKLVWRMAMRPGLAALRFAPDGRWAFALYPEEGRVALIDAASNTVAHELSGFAAPDQLTFTQRFAYVRNVHDPRLALIELASLNRGGEKPSVVWVALGQKKPALARELGRAPAIAVLPGGNEVIAASPADRSLFLYSEGMMAPRGTHINYGREPRAVLVLDRSLREVESGVYTARAEVRENGTYDVHVLLDSPRTVACLEWKVEGVPEEASGRRRLPLVLMPEFDPQQPLMPGEPTTLRFRLTPSAHVQDKRALRAEELQVLMFRPPSGHWLERPTPRQVAEGLFEVEVRPPAPGRYELLIGAESRQAPLGSLSPFSLGVQPRPGPPSH